MRPIIIALAIDPRSQCVLNALRERHFPPERNFIDAHIMLFHALDGSREQEIIDDVSALGGVPYHVRAQSLRSLGRGVAISIVSDQLIAMRTTLATRWANMLTAQDRERYWPHITIQNKVPPSEAKALLAAWQPKFQPFDILATGLSVYRYLDGPWELVRMVPFGPTEAA